MADDAGDRAASPAVSRSGMASPSSPTASGRQSPAARGGSPTPSRRGSAANAGGTGAFISLGSPTALSRAASPIVAPAVTVSVPTTEVGSPEPSASPTRSGSPTSRRLDAVGMQVPTVQRSAPHPGPLPAAHPTDFVRATKASLLFRRCGVNLEQAAVLDVRRCRLATFVGFEVCPALQMLFASHNCLKSLDGIEACHRLWRLNVSHNQLVSLEVLRRFAYMGLLDVTHNQLTWTQLQVLGNVHILQLECRKGNPALQGTMPEWQYRLAVLALLPRVWVLDGQFVTEPERAAAAQFADSADCPEALRQALALQSDGGFWSSPLLESPAASRFMQSVMKQPRRPDMQDPYRLKALAAMYEADFALLDDYVAKRREALGETSIRLPGLHIHALVQLRPQLQTDLAVCMAAVAEFLVPQQILDEALTVMLAAEVSPIIASDWCHLPPFGLVICAWALTEHMRTAKGAMQSVSPIHQQLWEAMPANGIVPAHAFSLSPMAQIGTIDVGRGGPDSQATLIAQIEQEAKAQAGRALRCRQAVILLSRSPSFPSLLDPSQVTGHAKHILAQVQPLLNAAGMGTADLTLDSEKIRRGSMPWLDNINRPYRRPWAEPKAVLEPRDSMPQALAAIDAAEPTSPMSATAPSDVPDMDGVRWGIIEPGTVWPTGRFQRSGHGITSGLTVGDVDDPNASAAIMAATASQLGIGSGGAVYKVDLGQSNSAVFAGVRLPAVGDAVVVGTLHTGPGPKDWDMVVSDTRITSVIAADVVELAPFSRVVYPPFYGRTWVAASSLFWVPDGSTGFWRHCTAQPKPVRTITMHRTNHGLARSGISRSEGVLNIPVNAADVERSGTLKLFTVNDTWDPHFVLAPPALIAAQNAALPAGAGWSELSSVPFSLVGKPSKFATDAPDALRVAATCTMKPLSTIDAPPLAPVKSGVNLVLQRQLEQDVVDAASLPPRTPLLATNDDGADNVFLTAVDADQEPPAAEQAQETAPVPEERRDSKVQISADTAPPAEVRPMSSIAASSVFTAEDTVAVMKKAMVPEDRTGHRTWFVVPERAHMNVGVSPLPWKMRTKPHAAADREAREQLQRVAAQRQQAIVRSLLSKSTKSRGSSSRLADLATPTRLAVSQSASALPPANLGSRSLLDVLGETTGPTQSTIDSLKLLFGDLPIRPSSELPQSHTDSDQPAVDSALEAAVGGSDEEEAPPNRFSNRPESGTSMHVTRITPSVSRNHTPRRNVNTARSMLSATAPAALFVEPNVPILASMQPHLKPRASLGLRPLPQSSSVSTMPSHSLPSPASDSLPTGKSLEGEDRKAAARYRARTNPLGTPNGTLGFVKYAGEAETS